MTFLSKLNVKAVFVLLFVAASPVFANTFATTLQPVTDALNSFACFLQKDWAVAIAVIAIVMMALGAFFGKITWGVVLTVLVALVFIFGAAQIVVNIANQSNSSNITVQDLDCS